MRVVPAVLTVLLLVVPAIASAQTVEVHGSAGPTVNGVGHSVAAGVGFSPTSRLTFMVDLEQTHLATRVQTDGRGTISTFRGGTVTLATAALRVSFLGRDRIGPYAIAGLGAGVSKPNVTPTFPNRVTNDVRAPFFGGGIEVPLTDRLSLLADARMMLVIGTESDELLAVVPVRAGVAWRF